MTGVNQLWGDGHVDWKLASRFDIAAMGADSRAIPCVIGGGIDTTYY